MVLRIIQEQVDEWIASTRLGYFKPLEIMVRLMEEVGELAREINHRFGPKRKKSSERTKELGDEMADVIFTLVCLANSLKIDLDKSFDRMMRKLNSRDKDRWEKKSPAGR
jgi:NTP pyrophosphatase (non-canonical NTP hydrolase)